jgi:Zn-finger nucleic acid-binding protein
MDCTNCGAPLPAKSNLCTYCKTLNDVDLRALPHDVSKGPESDRDCPRCRGKMRTIDLRSEGKFLIERCEDCLGIFFDPCELEELIDVSVSRVHEVDFERLHTMLEEEAAPETPVNYVPCPVCSALMNRRNYGTRSGVIVDTCKAHGIWLDGGELGRLLKWVKAGGGVHHGNADKERDRLEQRSQRQKRYIATALEPKHEVGQMQGGILVDLEGAIGALLRMIR